MDLSFSAEERAFRAEVRAFLSEALPDEIRAKVRDQVALQKDDYVRWQKILHAKGWIAPGWPKAFGGAEWTPTQASIFAL